MSTYEYVGLPLVEGAVSNTLCLDDCSGLIKVFLPNNIHEKFDAAIIHFGTDSLKISYESYQKKQGANFICNATDIRQYAIFYELFSGVSLLDTSGVYFLNVKPFTSLYKIKSGTPFYLQDLSTGSFLSYRNIIIDTWTGFQYIPSGASRSQACKLLFTNNKIKYIDLGFYLCVSEGIQERFFENGLSDSCANRILKGSNDVFYISFDWVFNEKSKDIFSIYSCSGFLSPNLNLCTPGDRTPTGRAYPIDSSPLTLWGVHF